EQVLGEQLAAFGMGHHVGIERIELRRAHRLVVVPPDLMFGLGIAHHELVAGGAAGMDSGAHHQGAIGGDLAFATADGLFVQSRCAEIPVHGFEVAKSMTAEAKSGVGHSCSEGAKEMSFPTPSKHTGTKIFDSGCTGIYVYRQYDICIT